ncbi:MAG: DUF2391 family protein [Candidatus Aenigmarchaeota archaeon]|nr:DUF2391 family protein [Candidatus Aenigmarchaeota archaeon]
MARALIAKLLRFGGRRMGGKDVDVDPKKLDAEVKKIDKIEMRLENAADKMIKSTEELENIKHGVLKRKDHLGWMGGQLTLLAMQDVVGAIFGAVFFVITQEIWDLSARLGALNIAAIAILSFFMGFSLVYMSRRRKLVSIRIFHTSFLRAIEIYLISFIVSLSLITVFSTAPTFDLMIKQAVVISFPAVITAATADLLFY